MKNINIDIGDEIPDRIRLQTYIEAKQHVEAIIKDSSYNVFKLNQWIGLCILLPCCLYDLKCFSDDQPNGKEWNHFDTVKSFPEIESYISIIEKANSHMQKHSIRLKCLNKAIQTLTS